MTDTVETEAELEAVWTASQNGSSKDDSFDGAIPPFNFFKNKIVVIVPIQKLLY
jgi:hypothetical protein